MKFTDLLKQLSEKAGIAADDKDLQAFITANPAIEIPDTVAQSFTANLMNEKEAKVNPNIKSHFTSTTLNGVDAEIETLLAELGIDETVKGEIKAEKSTYKRVPLLAKKIQALEKAKAAAGTGDKAALQKEIDRLNGEFTSLTDKHKNEIKTVQEQAEQNILEAWLTAKLSSKNFANKDVPLDVNLITAKALLQKGLSDKGVRLVRNQDNSIKLVRNDDTALPYTDNHKEVSFDSFTDSILATNKMLSTGNTPKPTTTPVPTGKTPIEVAPELTAHYERSIAEFQNGH